MFTRWHISYLQQQTGDRDTDPESVNRTENSNTTCCEDMKPQTRSDQIRPDRDNNIWDKDRITIKIIIIIYLSIHLLIILLINHKIQSGIFRDSVCRIKSSHWRSWSRRLRGSLHDYSQQNSWWSISRQLTDRLIDDRCIWITDKTPDKKYFYNNMLKSDSLMMFRMTSWHLIYQ